jgi:lysozyme family protein
MSIQLTGQLRDEYQRLFDTCVAQPGKEAGVLALVRQLQKNRQRYESVGKLLSIPWTFIAVVHNMECSQRFDRHLHNGDPLTARTVHVPAGRPTEGTPPFTWEESAIDSLRFSKLDQVKSWDVPGLIYQLESYNGFGYRLRHPEVLTPYLWAGSNHYKKGKFVADGKFDPDAISKQTGAAILVSRLQQVPPETLQTLAA